ncbi:hypothetical protein AAE478_000667 [Parahypoxylon ruwenzoriense]
MLSDLSFFQQISLRNLSIAWLSLVATFIVVYWIYNICFHPLASFPGPLLYSASELPLRWYQIRGKEPFKLAELHRKYGPVVRIAPNDISYTSTDAWKAIYGHHAAASGVHLTRNLPKEPDINQYGALGIFSADAEDHARQRRQLAPAFSERALREQEPLISRYVDRLMKRLRENAEADKTVDLSAWFNFTTFDIIGDLWFGRDVFECVEKSRCHPMVLELLSRFEVLVFVIAIQRAAPWLSCALNILMPSRLREQQQAQANSIKHMVDRRLHSATSRPDFTTLILRESKKGEPSMLENGEIYPTSANMVLAGSETVATALSGCIFLLLHHPDIMAKLKREIRTGFRSETEITASGLSDKKYLIAVLSEVLRIYPPVPGFLERGVPAGGCTILGRFVPGGTTVGFTALSAFRDESYFKDGNEFIPERWLDMDPRYDSDNRDVFQPFGVGPLNCIGVNLAHLELRMILARLVWNFDIELMPGSDDWLNQKVFVIWYRLPLLARLIPRDSPASS